ncbi:MAG TPA: glycosyltransferase family 39 protein [Tepidisphaeraceae bacterium]|nr:glycosyltransferase family 39 protein [Tepidisphaeraceae bacterium]
MGETNAVNGIGRALGYIKSMAARNRVVIGILLALGAGMFLPGIDWGLPSRDVDPYLFGEHEIWTGDQILKLAGPTENADRGADVASHPGASRSRAVIINATDEDRARIIRRYRLMSYQPDEWNTLKALSEMKPGQGNFDPKLYQYGGLWVYPVGAMLKIASMLHLIDLRSNVAFYLDHPEALGRFYIVARLWSVAWGMVGILAVYAIVRRIVGGWLFPAVAAICFMSMPIVVNMAHEAKPHLAGAVLTLLAVLAASRYVERGSRSAWMMAGAFCGAALSMVLSAAPIFIVLPVMARMRRGSWSVLGGAIAIGAAVYIVANPYLFINLLRHRGVVESNLGNSRAMYQFHLTGTGVMNAISLTEAGTSPVLAIVGAIGAVVLGRRAIRTRGEVDPAAVRRRAIGLSLAAPALCVAIQCAAVATGKPGEFGRFMLIFDIFLMIEAVVFAATFLHRPSIRIAAAGVLLASTALPGFCYLRAFSRDSHKPTTRMIAATRIRSFGAFGDQTLAVYADPAPYCVPPVDVFRWKIALLPAGAGPGDGLRAAEDSVQAVDLAVSRRWSIARRVIQVMLESTPISWADKQFDVRSRYALWPGAKK